MAGYSRGNKELYQLIGDLLRDLWRGKGLYFLFNLYYP